MLRKIIKAFILFGRSANRRALLQYWVGASIEHDALLRSQRFDVVVDVGANKGQFSLATRYFQPEAKIYAFEPLSRAASLYREIFSADQNVKLHQYAVGPTRASTKIQLSAHDDSSSLLTISDLQSTVFPGTHAVGTQDVEVAPLTDFIGKDDLKGVALLKLDVQGYELEALKSAESILPLFQVIYAEASFVPFYEGQVLADGLIAYLQQKGFVLVSIMNPYFDPKTGFTMQADLVFRRAS